MGWSRLSKVVGHWILLTDKALISSDERKVKSTLEMESETGFDIFMMPSVY